MADNAILILVNLIKFFFIQIEIGSDVLDVQVYILILNAYFHCQALRSQYLLLC